MNLEKRRDLFDQLGNVIATLKWNHSGLIEASLGSVAKRLLLQIQTGLEESIAAGNQEDALCLISEFDRGVDTLLNDYRISAMDLAAMHLAYTTMRAWAKIEPDSSAEIRQ